MASGLLVAMVVFFGLVFTWRSDQAQVLPSILSTISSVHIFLLKVYNLTSH
jgi:hypothetical protein